MREENGVLEDISAVIGFTATTRLVALFGPGNLLVPCEPRPEHVITQAIGLAAMRHLVQAWGGQVLKLSLHADYHHARLVRGVGEMLRGGMAVKDVGVVVGLTERQVRRIRLEAEDLGILPRVLRAKCGQGD